MHPSEELRNYYNNNFINFYSQFFDNHKASGDNWQVLCPFHDDKNPSMSINIKTGVFNCFACGEQGDFIKFYMKKKGVNFKTAITYICQDCGLTSQTPMEKIKMEIVKIYDYKDIDGKLISQTIRFKPKTFRQRVPGKNGEWIWSLKGVQTILYNLIDVSTANKVLVVEGEKCCDAAKNLGITATTNPMGAGKWQEKYNKHLYGKEIILIPDNDIVGMKHMITVGKQLKKHATVKWLDFVDKGEKGFDLTDFIESFENEFVAMREVDNLIRTARLFDENKIIIPAPDTVESENIKKWITMSPGEFSTKDVDYDMGFNEPEEKQKRTKILEKFVSEKILSRAGKYRGHYRPYRKELEIIDFKTATDDFLNIWLPLGLHKLVGIMPGNIIIFAGEANSGKSAMMFNIIKENMKTLNVHYFNSEMGGNELKGRLLKFEGIDINDWKFNSYSRGADFEDVVFGGEQSLNLIDFLEIHDDFYLVGEKIKQIHAALNGGVAIIAIQKNKGAEFAVGGNRTMEKARLVVNISPGKFEITKAKNFIDPNQNPNGLICEWKLINGCKFIANRDGWRRNENF